MKVMFADNYNVEENNMLLDLTEDQMRLLDFLKENDFLWDDLQIISLKENDFKKV